MKSAHGFALVIAISTIGVTASQPGFSAITYIGSGAIPGTALDTTDPSPVTAGGIPGNRVGGFGSAITYTGYGNRYIATPDRGPGDGITTYKDRFYELDITVTPGATPGSGIVSPLLSSVQLMTKAPGVNFTGNSSAFDAANPANTLRFDPEGVRVSRSGTSIFVSDEYGPNIYEFNRSNGQLIRSLDVPARFQIANPNGNGTLELPPSNTAGRQSNRGMEGLAITPNGSLLVGAMQNALIQDGALSATNGRIGLNNRILSIDTTSGETHEYVYKLDGTSFGVNEILAINDHEFLVIERDGAAGTSASFKKIFKIDLTGATDVSDVAALPTGDLPAGITPVAKSSPFLDLLDPAFGLAGASFPEKIEGLAFGPDFDNGDHLLLVTADNDFFTDRPNLIYAFRIGANDIGFVAQQIAAVPEPGTYALLVAGLVGIGALRVIRRRE